MPEILSNINWIDILFIILLAGMSYKGTKTGVGGQIISFVGYFFVLFLALRFYERLADAVFGFLLHSWAEPIAFFVIAFGVFVVIKFCERTIGVIGEGLGAVEKTGGVFVAVLRACLLFGIIGIFILLMPLKYMHASATVKSKTCMFFVNMDVGIYSWVQERVGLARKDKREEIVDELVDFKSIRRRGAR